MTMLTEAVEFKEKYFTVAELAELTGETEKAVRDLQRIGVIEPALTKGLLQFKVSAVFRVSLFRGLQKVTGKTALAVRIIERAAPLIEKLCTSGAVYRNDLSVAYHDAIVRAVLTPEVLDEAMQVFDRSELASA